MHHLSGTTQAAEPEESDVLYGVATVRTSSSRASNGVTGGVSPSQRANVSYGNMLAVQYASV